MEEQIEPWELPSGTWMRNRVSEDWRLVATRSGTKVDPSVPAPDVARLIAASCEVASGKWFPPDFRYSLRDGALLRAAGLSQESTWVPPFGDSGLTGMRGLRRTSLPLSLARMKERTPGGRPDRVLPPLPQGHHRFLVGRFDAACPTLLAVDPEEGEMLVLLPESKQWLPLARTTGASWAQRLRNPRGWRMELVQGAAYCPCENGLAAITPSVLGLHYAIDFAGEGPALGGPVAWDHEIWLPVLGRGDTVHLVGKPHPASGPMHVVLPTQLPAPLHGFEAPIFDDRHLVWPCDEGQLVFRQKPGGGKQLDWIGWPDALQPVFAMGCPHLEQHEDSWWQLCRGKEDGRFACVTMATPSPRIQRLDAPRLSTGHVAYRGTQRLAEDPLHDLQLPHAASAEIVVPLLESARDGAVIALRMPAPRGLGALLQGGNEPARAILQVDVPGKPAVPFGAIAVKKPWAAQLFVHEGHLWVHHPDLAQAPGWQLEA